MKIVRILTLIHDILVDLCKNSKNDNPYREMRMIELRELIDELHTPKETEIREEKHAVEDLGWANGWSEDPQIVKDCREAGHKRTEINRDPSWHGLHTEVRCDICGYVYHYDSSG